MENREESKSKNICIWIDLSIFFIWNMSSPRSSRLESDLLRRLSSMTLNTLSPTSYRIIHTVSPTSFKKICPPAPRASSSSSFCWSEVSYLQSASKYNYDLNK